MQKYIDNFTIQFSEIYDIHTFIVLFHIFTTNTHVYIHKYVYLYLHVQ